ncbi:hypothetical protein [Amycolatopsis sp. DG1A-15b]|uniref:hypothetical protein n=1 Tax=Amycolatopsis sp. DG1A-15b TaxID=3052846 RepID=UPI00255B554A|nr:hypothetical protein [Amycolatopsis sp. DG1A-15b]WIX92579.1 hypothetical protein QRY02_19905 [Amycolatopsis sp. DG1A-15b]
MNESGIDEDAIARFAEDLQREFDKHGPIVIPVEADMSGLPSLGQGATVNNYNGPVFNGGVSGAQIAWNNDTVTQNQQNASSDVALGYESLAKLITDLLQQLPQVGLDEQARLDTEDAAKEVLKEITGTEAPEPGRLRRALTVLRGGLAPIATGIVSGLAAGAEDWAKAAIAGLTGIC